ncbi:hypothetical protein THAOC_31433, partial [Thalassiosira oceanica]
GLGVKDEGLQYLPNSDTSPAPEKPRGAMSSEVLGKDRSHTLT